MTNVTQQRAELRPEDRDRMQRLSEEVRGRLQEMALITTRTLGIALDSQTAVKFAPQELDRGADETGMHIEIVCTPDGCGCYVDPPGICEFPCGAAGPL